MEEGYNADNMLFEIDLDKNLILFGQYIEAFVLKRFFFVNDYLTFKK